MRRSISTTVIGQGVKLLSPKKVNLTCINIWGPGYTIPKPVYDEKGQKILDSKGNPKITPYFIPTTTYDLALMMLKNYYQNPQQFELHKKDVSPGHVSLLLNEKYLSIGARSYTEIRPFTLHNLFLVEDFQTDLLGMDRFPLYQFDLYTLDKQKIARFIDDFGKASEKYTIFGRFISSSTEVADNCVTAVHSALLSGGFSQMLPYLEQMTQEGAVTPLMFRDLVQAAYEVEGDRHPEIMPLRKEFQQGMKAARHEFQAHQEKELAKKLREADDNSHTPHLGI